MPREPMETTYIENTTMKKVINSLGRHTQYAITPNENYVLHDIMLDEFAEYDEEGNGIGEATRLRYYADTRTVSVNYDFDTNPREFYAVLRSSVPADDICDNTQPPEIMSEDTEAEREG